MRLKVAGGLRGGTGHAVTADVRFPRFCNVALETWMAAFGRETEARGAVSTYEFMA